MFFYTIYERTRQHTFRHCVSHQEVEGESQTSARLREDEGSDGKQGWRYRAVLLKKKEKKIK